ncbi:MAG: hypothetical protein ACI37Z_10360 [Candidatus Gastranaerophilaceae bacterium]
MKLKKFKRILSFFLAFVMLITVIPAGCIEALANTLSGQASITSGDYSMSWDYICTDYNYYVNKNGIISDNSAPSTALTYSLTYASPEVQNDRDTVNLLVKTVNVVKENGVTVNRGHRQVYYSDVPIYRISRSGGWSNDNTIAAVDGVINIDVTKSELTKQAKALNVTEKQLVMLYYVLQNGFKQFTAAGPQDVNEQKELTAQHLAFAATQMLIWEITEGKRTDFGNTTVYSYVNPTNGRLNVAQYEKTSYGDMKSSYDISKSYPYYWHDLYYSTLNTVKSSCPNMRDYYAEILNASYIQSKYNGEWAGQLTYFKDGKSTTLNKSETPLKYSSVDTFENKENGVYSAFYNLNADFLRVVGKGTGQLDIDKIVLPIRSFGKTVRADGSFIQYHGSSSTNKTTAYTLQLKESANFKARIYPHDGVAAGRRDIIYNDIPSHSFIIRGITNDGKYYYVNWVDSEGNGHCGYITETELIANAICATDNNGNIITPSSYMKVKYDYNNARLWLYTYQSIAPKTDASVYWDCNGVVPNYYNKTMAFTGNASGITQKFACGGNAIDGDIEIKFNYNSCDLKVVCTGTNRELGEYDVPSLERSVPYGYVLENTIKSTNNNSVFNCYDYQITHPNTHNPSDKRIKYVFENWTTQDGKDIIFDSNGYATVDGERMVINTDTIIYMNIKMVYDIGGIEYYCAHNGGSGEKIGNTFTSSKEFKHTLLSAPESDSCHNDNEYHCTFKGWKKEGSSDIQQPGTIVDFPAGNGTIDKYYAQYDCNGAAKYICADCGQQLGNIEYIPASQNGVLELTVSHSCPYNINSETANYTFKLDSRNSSTVYNTGDKFAVTAHVTRKVYVIFDTDSNTLRQIKYVCPIDNTVVGIQRDTIGTKYSALDGTSHISDCQGENGSKTVKITTASGQVITVNLEDVELTFAYWDKNPDSFIAESTAPSGALKKGQTVSIPTNNTIYYAKYYVRYKQRTNFVCTLDGGLVDTVKDYVDSTYNAPSVAGHQHTLPQYIQIGGVTITTEDLDIELAYWDKNPDSFIAESSTPSGAVKAGEEYKIAQTETTYYAKYKIKAKKTIVFKCSLCGATISSSKGFGGETCTVPVDEAKTHVCEGTVTVNGITKNGYSLNKIFRSWSTKNHNFNYAYPALEDTTEVVFSNEAITEDNLVTYYYAQYNLKTEYKAQSNLIGVDSYINLLQNNNEAMSTASESLEALSETNTDPAVVKAQQVLNDWKTYLANKQWNAVSSNRTLDYSSVSDYSDMYSCELINSGPTSSVIRITNTSEVFVIKYISINDANGHRTIYNEPDEEGLYQSVFDISVNADDFDEADIQVYFDLCATSYNVNIKKVIFFEDIDFETAINPYSDGYVASTETINKNVGAVYNFNDSENGFDYGTDDINLLTCDCIIDDTYYKGNFTGYYGIVKNKNYTQYNNSQDNIKTNSALDNLKSYSDIDIYLYYRKTDAAEGISFTLTGREDVVNKMTRVQADAFLKVNDLRLYKTTDFTNIPADYDQFDKTYESLIANNQIELVKANEYSDGFEGEFNAASADIADTCGTDIISSGVKLIEDTQTTLYPCRECGRYFPNKQHIGYGYVKSTTELDIKGDVFCYADTASGKSCSGTSWGTLLEKGYLCEIKGDEKTTNRKAYCSNLYAVNSSTWTCENGHKMNSDYKNCNIISEGKASRTFTISHDILEEGCYYFFVLPDTQEIFYAPNIATKNLKYSGYSLTYFSEASNKPNSTLLRIGVSEGSNFHSANNTTVLVSSEPINLDETTLTCPACGQNLNADTYKCENPGCDLGGQFPKFSASGYEIAQTNEFGEIEFNISPITESGDSFYVQCLSDLTINGETFSANDYSNYYSTYFMYQTDYRNNSEYIPGSVVNSKIIDTYCDKTSASMNANHFATQITLVNNTQAGINFKFKTEPNVREMRALYNTVSPYSIGVAIYKDSNGNNKFDEEELSTPYDYKIASSVELQEDVVSLWYTPYEQCKYRAVPMFFDIKTKEPIAALCEYNSNNAYNYNYYSADYIPDSVKSIITLYSVDMFAQDGSDGNYTGLYTDFKYTGDSDCYYFKSTKDTSDDTIYYNFHSSNDNDTKGQSEFFDWGTELNALGLQINVYTKSAGNYNYLGSFDVRSKNNCFETVGGYVFSVANNNTNRWDGNQYKDTALTNQSYLNKNGFKITCINNQSGEDLYYELTSSTGQKAMVNSFNMISLGEAHNTSESVDNSYTQTYSLLKTMPAVTEPIKAGHIIENASDEGVAVTTEVIIKSCAALTGFVVGNENESLIKVLNHTYEGVPADENNIIAIQNEKGTIVGPWNKVAQYILENKTNKISFEYYGTKTYSFEEDTFLKGYTGNGSQSYSDIMAAPGLQKLENRILYDGEIFNDAYYVSLNNDEYYLAKELEEMIKHISVDYQSEYPGYVVIRLEQARATITQKIDISDLKSDYEPTFGFNYANSMISLFKNPDFKVGLFNNTSGILASNVAEALENLNTEEQSFFNDYVMQNYKNFEHKNSNYCITDNGTNRFEIMTPDWGWAPETEYFESEIENFADSEHTFYIHSISGSVNENYITVKYDVSAYKTQDGKITLNSFVNMEQSEEIQFDSNGLPIYKIGDMFKVEDSDKNQYTGTLKELEQQVFENRISLRRVTLTFITEDFTKDKLSVDTSIKGDPNNYRVPPYKVEPTWEKIKVLENTQDGDVLTIKISVPVKEFDSIYRNELKKYFPNLLFLNKKTTEYVYMTDEWGNEITPSFVNTEAEYTSINSSSGVLFETTFDNGNPIEDMRNITVQYAYRDATFYLYGNRAHIYTHIENGEMEIKGNPVSNTEPTTVAIGKDAPVTFRPYDGYYIKRVLIDGEDLSRSEIETLKKDGTIDEYEYTFKDVQSDHSIVVETAKLIKYSVITSIANGTITPSVYDLNADYYPTHTVTFVPNEGYKVTQILVDGSPVSLNGYVFGGEITFTDKATHTVDVTCESMGTLVVIYLHKNAVNTNDLGSPLLTDYWLDGAFSINGKTLQSLENCEKTGIYDNELTEGYYNKEDFPYYIVYSLNKDITEPGTLSLTLSQKDKENSLIGDRFQKYHYCFEEWKKGTLEGTEGEEVEVGDGAIETPPIFEDDEGNTNLPEQDLDDIEFTGNFVHSPASHKNTANETVSSVPDKTPHIFKAGCYYTQSKPRDIEVTFVQPNSEYHYDTTVVTTFKVTNYEKKDFKDITAKVNTKLVYIDDNGKYALTDYCPTYNNTVPYATDNQKLLSTNTVIPAQGSNIFYVKWTVPNMNKMQTCSVTKNGVTKQYRVVGVLPCATIFSESECIYSETPDEQWLKEEKFVKLSQINDTYKINSEGYNLEGGVGFNYQDSQNNKAYANTASWQQWEYQNGKFVKMNYSAKLDYDFITLSPYYVSFESLYGGETTDSRGFANPSAVKNDNSVETKSGYGVQLEVTGKNLTDAYDNDISSSIKDISGNYASSNYNGWAQTVEVYFPEYYYTNEKYKTEYAQVAWKNSTYTNLLTRTQRPLDTSSYVASNGYLYRFAPFTNGGETLDTHIIPIWYPDDTDYKVQVRISDCWTPAGELSYMGDSNSVIVKGSLFEDYKSRETAIY